MSSQNTKRISSQKRLMKAVPIVYLKINQLKMMMRSLRPVSMTMEVERIAIA